MLRTVTLSFLVAACGGPADLAPAPPGSLSAASAVPDAPPPAYLEVLAVDMSPPLRAGASSTLTVANAAPGEVVHLAYSTTGIGESTCAGAAPPCLDLWDPVLHGTEVANAAGVARFDVEVPEGAEGAWVGFQALILRGPDAVDSVESPVVAGWVSPPLGSPSSTYMGPTLIHQIQMTCDPMSSHWRYAVDTVGWTSDALVNASDTRNWPPWDEEHSLDTVDFGPLGHWDQLERVLVDVTDIFEVEPDVSTLFRCDVHLTDGTMTWAFRVYDVDGALADCASFGHDPEGYTTGAYPPMNPVSAPAELLDCQIW